jgi:hypothetical protein
VVADAGARLARLGLAPLSRHPARARSGSGSWGSGNGSGSSSGAGAGGSRGGSGGGAPLGSRDPALPQPHAPGPPSPPSRSPPQRPATEMEPLLGGVRGPCAGEGVGCGGGGGSLRQSLQRSDPNPPRKPDGGWMRGGTRPWSPTHRSATEIETFPPRPSETFRDLPRPSETFPPSTSPPHRPATETEPPLGGVLRRRAWACVGEGAGWGCVGCGVWGGGVVTHRSATEIAAMRRGCVTTTPHEAPQPASAASSSRYWGTWGEGAVHRGGGTWGGRRRGRVGGSVAVRRGGRRG